MMIEGRASCEEGTPLGKLPGRHVSRARRAGAGWAVAAAVSIAWRTPFLPQQRRSGETKNPGGGNNPLAGVYYWPIFAKWVSHVSLYRERVMSYGHDTFVTRHERVMSA